MGELEIRDISWEGHHNTSCAGISALFQRYFSVISALFQRHDLCLLHKRVVVELLTLSHKQICIMMR